MGKRVFAFGTLALVCCCIIGMVPLVSAQTEKGAQPQEGAQSQENAQPQATDQQVTVKGTVEEVAEDGSYVIVSGTKIMTTTEFLEDSYLEEGDKVEITADKTPEGLKAASYKYLFFEEEEEKPSEGKASTEAAGDEMAEEEIQAEANTEKPVAE